jgi:hypothetical protein
MTPDFGSEEGVVWSDRAVPRGNCAVGRRSEGGMDGIESWSRGRAIERRSKGGALPISSCRSPLSLSLLSPPLRCHPPFPPVSGGTGMQGQGQREPPRGAAALLHSLLWLHSFSSSLGGEHACWIDYGCGSTCRRTWCRGQPLGSPNNQGKPFLFFQKMIKQTHKPQITPRIVAAWCGEGPTA